MDNDNTRKKANTPRSEASEQMALIRWADTAAAVEPDRFGVLNSLYHIPNEGKRSDREGVTLRRMGMRRGVPDLCLPVPAGGKHGLFVEMKSEKGRVSQEQTAWIDYLNRQGYKAVVAYGCEDAIRQITEYLEG